NSDVVVDLKQGDLQILQKHREDWRVHLIDTGLHTLTGGRLKQMLPHLGDETFMLTYGDGVCNVNLHDLLAYHNQKQALATVTAVRPSARFGNLVLDDDRVVSFTEKNQAGAGRINGGFIMMQPQIAQYLPEDDVSLEQYTLEAIAADGKLAAFRHDGFWQCMDTKREVDLLNRLWEQPDCPWRNWCE
ncbi:MAG: glucose-1-phosphate cytidylyltransferase, partial [Phycisphaeraceae bacterium JB051]